MLLHHRSLLLMWLLYLLIKYISDSESVVKYFVKFCCTGCAVHCACQYHLEPSAILNLNGQCNVVPADVTWPLNSVCTKEEKHVVTRFLSAEGVPEGADWLLSVSTVWEQCLDRV